MKTVEDIILDFDQRNISSLRKHLPTNFCDEASNLILENPGTVLIATGFYILAGGAAETDGPPGAVALGDALNSLEKFKINMFDLAFIDGDKINYINYYNRCMQVVKNNGIIVLDNMLWGGSVLNPKDEQSKTLNQLAQIINDDDRNINILLPIRDGIMICIKNNL